MCIQADLLSSTWACQRFMIMKLRVDFVKINKIYNIIVKSPSEPEYSNLMNGISKELTAIYLYYRSLFTYLRLTQFGNLSWMIGLEIVVND